MKILNHKIKGFTLLEILIVMGIIAVLVGISAVSYSSYVKSARDARRKTDLEQIRSALEMYRSDNGYYPSGSGATATSLTVLTGSPKYLGSIPSDPLSSQSYSYQYTASPAGCNNTSGNYCTDYSLGCLLENSSSSCTVAPINACKDSTVCNYCLGSYGQS